MASAVTLTACGGGGGEDLELSFRYNNHTVGLWGDVNDNPSITGLEGHSPRCRVSDGKLPRGLALDRHTCVITGQPDEIGDFTATIRLTVSGYSGHVDTTYARSVVTLQPSYRYEYGAKSAGWAFEFADTPTIDFYTRQAGDVVSYEYLGGLPDGLNFDTATGKISGMPSETGTFHPLIRLSITRAGRTHISSEQQAPLSVNTPIEAIFYKSEPMTAGQSYVYYPSQTDSSLGVRYSDYGYSLQSLPGCPGVLPQGWTFGEGSGRIEGTATPGMNQCVGVRMQVRQNGLVKNYDMPLQLTSP